MATHPNATNATTPSGSDALAANCSQLCTGAIAAGGLLVVAAAAGVWLYVSKGYGLLPYAFWAILLGVVCLVAGIWGTASRSAAGWSDAERSRALLLVLLGATGLFTALLGLGIPFAYPETFAADLLAWRQHMVLVMVCGGVLLGGLLVMLLGLQLSRTFGLDYPNLRRTIFGYNAVLGSALLLCILGVINLLPYIPVVPFNYLNETYDWTSQRLYTLAPESKAVLNSLKEPAKVYVILYERDRMRGEVLGLLENCRSVTPNLTWQMLSPEYNADTIRELRKKYQFPEDMGLLIVCGNDANTADTFVARNLLDTLDPSSNPMDRPKYLFTGERPFINALSFASQGKTKIHVYFTQGHGEKPLDARSMERGNESLSSLREGLVGRNFEVQALNLDGQTKEIPAEADVVAVVAPTMPFEPNVLDALRKYLRGDEGKKKGHLFVLLGPARPSSSGPLAMTGLEGLLAEYDVKVGQDRVLSARLEEPEDVVVIFDENSRNALAKANFTESGEPIPFVFRNARTVSAQPAGPGGAGRFTVEPLLLAPLHFLPWAEPNLEGSAKDLAAELRRNRPLLLRKVSPVPLSLAVAISEGKSPEMPMPEHPPVGGDTQPRMLVFGSASWVTSKALSGPGGAEDLDLFASGVSWLRERPNLGTGSVGKPHDVFSLPKQPDGGLRLVLLPVALLMLAVVVLGSGIWVVRRR